jgi:hypothetical protein
MATSYTNPDYPHTASITRVSLSETPPFTASSTAIWSGACDCQVGIGGKTERRESVFVSDYTIYTACIESELKVGDQLSVTRQAGHTPLTLTLEQFSTDNIWIENGVAYGTTIWANEVKN